MKVTRLKKGNLLLTAFPAQTAPKETLFIILRDRLSGIGVRLSYSVFFEEDVIARSAEILNDSREDITLTGAMSMSTDLPLGDFDMITLDGTHVRERQIERKPLRNGTQSIESPARRLKSSSQSVRCFGRSSHDGVCR